MFDFVSTREGTDPQTARAARLVAFVIVSFVRAASVKPTTAEKDSRSNVNVDAWRAVQYLFDDTSPFERHVEEIGGSAVAMREALLSKRPLGFKSPFTEDMRKVIQVRYRWWKSAGQPIAPEADQGETA